METLTSEKIKVSDFGLLVKARVLTAAYLHVKLQQSQPTQPLSQQKLFDGHEQCHDWWRHVSVLAAMSKSYKQDSIAAIYGMRLKDVFAELDLNEYVCRIDSFIVLHFGKHKHIRSSEELATLVSQSGRITVKAVGVSIWADRSLSTGWFPTNKQTDTVTWFFKPQHLVPITVADTYDSLNPGDLLAFKQTMAVVIDVKKIRRPKFYNSCSWTSNKITIVSGKKFTSILRLTTGRSYKVVRSHEIQKSSPDTAQ